MKKGIFGIVIVFVIMGAAYYYFVVRNKKEAGPGNEEKTTSDANTRMKKMPTEKELLALGYNADEIATILSSEAYKNGTLTNY